jgi:AraC-like DNA-binding protein
VLLLTKYDSVCSNDLGKIGHNVSMSVLACFVANTHAATSALDRVNRLPDGTSTLIFRLLEDGRADLSVLGPRRRALYKFAPPSRAVSKVVFRPGGGFPFFDVPLGELTDRVVPLRDLWGTRAEVLLDKLVHAGTNAQRLAEMRGALADKLGAPAVFAPAAAPVVTETLMQLTANHTTLHDVARKLNVSERHLRRAFSEVVGLSPKRYARIVRFKHAVARASDGAVDWSAIAADCGYFDQAHMCADFQDLAGITPMAFMRGDAVDRLRERCV